MVNNAPSPPLIEVPPPSPPSSEEKSEEEEEFIIEYLDPYNTNNLIPLSASLQSVLSMGYNTREIQTLRADALDLILEDGIRRPRRGVPVRWRIDEGMEREVFVKKQSRRRGKEEEGTGVGGTSKVEEGGGAERMTDEGSKGEKARNETPATRKRTELEEESIMDGLGAARQRRRTPPASEEDNAPVRQRQRRPAPSDDTAGRARSSGRQQRQRDRPPNPRSRESSRERGRQRQPLSSGRPSTTPSETDDPPAPEKFWPDLPTFRQYLRREAEWRLRILGPGWTNRQERERLAIRFV